MSDDLLARAAAHMVKFPHHDLVADLAKALREAEHWSAEFHHQLVNIACALGDGPTGEGDTASIVNGRLQDHGSDADVRDGGDTAMTKRGTHPTHPHGCGSSRRPAERRG